SMHFFFNDTPPTDIYTLSLHDALPISISRTFSSSFRLANRRLSVSARCCSSRFLSCWSRSSLCAAFRLSCSAAMSCLRLSSSTRSEEHTSELQSRRDLVCRLLLEKKKK